MIVKTKLAEQAEQFEIDGVHYVGRRVLAPDDVYSEAVMERIEHSVFDDDFWKTYVLFRLDYDRGLIFVDPSILRPYQRPERKEND